LRKYAFLPVLLGLVLFGSGLSAQAATPVPAEDARIDARRTQILDSSYEKGYKNLVEALHERTGKWVGILGVDYEYAQIFTPEEPSRTNKVLIDYAAKGGLITFNLTPQNPWVNDESDLAKNPGTWNGLAGTRNPEGLKKVTSLDDLIDPSKPVNVAWMRKLDRIAAALQELKDAGVIVLWRPMQEMNGNWFWWGMKSHPKDPAPYVHVFRPGVVDHRQQERVPADERSRRHHPGRLPLVMTPYDASDFRTVMSPWRASSFLRPITLRDSASAWRASNLPTTPASLC
jgi:hypothetical protein